jgi:hypothetical protein
MSVSHQQREFVSWHTLAPDEAAVSGSGDALHDGVLRDVAAAGQRRASPAAVTRASISCWRWLACRPVTARHALQQAVREAVATGRTTARAWLPLAVAETDPQLLRAAIAGYLGAAPRSADQRGQALDDVFEWFRRGLTLDRVAVFEALLELREPAVNQRLAVLRGRLTDDERERVRREFVHAADATTREFLDEWCGGDWPACMEQAQRD